MEDGYWGDCLGGSENYDVIYNGGQLIVRYSLLPHLNTIAIVDPSQLRKSPKVRN